MKTNSFFHYFDGEEVQKGTRVWGKFDVDYSYEDNKVTEIHVSNMSKMVDYLVVDLNLPPRLDGVYQACEQHLTDIQQENY